MAKVTLRFHGRFLFADATTREGARVGRISAIAAQYDERGAGRHQTLMTIRHSDVVFMDKTFPLTTFDPHFRLTSPDVGSGDPELMVWDLSGLTVSYSAPGPANLTPKGEVYRLIELEAFLKRSAVLDKSVLRPDLRRSNAVIELTGADGVSETPPKPVKMNLASEESIRKGQPVRFEHPPTKPVEREPADLVTFTVTVPDPPGKLPCLTLTCKSASGEVVGTIALKPGAAVGISNSCPQIEAPPESDLEFSRYYDLLSAPRPADVLLPIAPSTALMEGLRCYMLSTISYNEA